MRQNPNELLGQPNVSHQYFLSFQNFSYCVDAIQSKKVMHVKITKVLIIAQNIIIITIVIIGIILRHIFLIVLKTSRHYALL